MTNEANLAPQNIKFPESVLMNFAHIKIPSKYIRNNRPVISRHQPHHLGLAPHCKETHVLADTARGSRLVSGISSAVRAKLEPTSLQPCKL